MDFTRPRLGVVPPPMLKFPQTSSLSAPASTALVVYDDEYEMESIQVKRADFMADWTESTQTSTSNDPEVADMEEYCEARS